MFSASLIHAPELSLRWIPVWRRNLLVWRKLAIASVLAPGNIADPLLYMLALGYGARGHRPRRGPEGRRVGHLRRRRDGRRDQLHPAQGLRRLLRDRVHRATRSTVAAATSRHDDAFGYGQSRQPIGYNAFVTLDWQKDQGLAASARPFSRTVYRSATKASTCSAGAPFRPTIREQWRVSSIQRARPVALRRNRSRRVDESRVAASTTKAWSIRCRRPSASMSLAGATCADRCRHASLRAIHLLRMAI